MIIPEWINNLSQSIVLLVVSIGVRALFSIRDELRKLNGRMATLETKLTAHDELDDERFDQVRREIRERPRR